MRWGGRLLAHLKSPLNSLAMSHTRTTEPYDAAEGLLGQAAGSSARRNHVCCVCGHEWQSLDPDTERKVLKAMEVNKDGPYCALCGYLELASRIADARGSNLVEAATEYRRMACARPQPKDETQ